MPLKRIGKGRGNAALLELYSDLPDMGKELKKLSGLPLDKAQSSAINKSLGKANTQAKRLIAEKRNILGGAVGRRMRQQKATPANLNAAIKAKGRMLRLTVTKGKAVQLKGGVRVPTEKGKRTFIRGAFLARLGGKQGTEGYAIGPQAHLNVYKRLPNARHTKRYREGGYALPVRGLTKPSIAHTLVKEDVGNKVVETFDKAWLPNIRNQVERQLALASKRWK